MAMDTVMRLRSAADGHPTGFSYKGPHRYLVTLQPFRGRAVFTEKAPVVKVLDVLRETALKHHFDVIAYSFVPDVLRLVIQGKTGQSDMKAFLQEFRFSASATLESQLGHPLWRRRYLERVLRKGEETASVAREVFQTPVRLGLAASPERYEFQGSFVADISSFTIPTPKPRRLRFRRGH